MLRHRTDVRLVEVELKSLAERRRLASFAVQVGHLEAFKEASMFPLESAAQSGAVSQRWSAFRGGRACARAALGKLGQPPVAIPADPSGAPIWPHDFVGSITHTNDIAAAVVALSPPTWGLGLDVESDEPLDDAAMLQLVCRPEELVPGCDPHHATSLRRGKLLFVVKEAVYKLYWPHTKTFLDFHDLTVVIDEAEGTFRAALVRPHLPGISDVRSVSGRFTQVESLFIALATLS